MWIPRGRLYHSIPQSLKYLIWALFGGLKINDSDKQELENRFSDFIGVRHCKIFPSARIALYFSLKAQNLPAGTKVLMPPITIKPMLDIIYSLNLEPVFVDLDLNNYAFDTADLLKKIDPNTKVLFLTYLFGMVPDMDSIKKIVDDHSLILIEDFSQAIGSTFNNNKLGSYGLVSIYSASSIKTLDTLGGGFAVTNEPTINSYLLQSQKELSGPKRIIVVKKAVSNLMRNLGTNRIIFSFLTIHVINFLRKISQDSANRMTGTRSQIPLENLPTDWFREFSQVQCRIALEQISELKTKLNSRVHIASTILGSKNSEVAKFDVYWQLCVISTDIDKVFKNAIDSKIDISQTSLSLISENKFYPHFQKCPNAVELYTKSFFVPCYPQLSFVEIERLRNWLRRI